MGVVDKTLVMMDLHYCVSRIHFYFTWISNSLSSCFTAMLFFQCYVLILTTFDKHKKWNFQPYFWKHGAVNIGQLKA